MSNNTTLPMPKGTVSISAVLISVAFVINLNPRLHSESFAPEDVLHGRLSQQEATHTYSLISVILCFEDYYG